MKKTTDTLTPVSYTHLDVYKRQRKEWCNAKTILNGMFSYAVRKKYLGENPMSSVQILVKYRQVVRKTGKTETYNSDELEKLNEFLDQMYAETGDSACLAIKINFMLGLRVGELVALKWEDFADDKHLHIVREEVRNQVTNQICVVEHTKTHKDRFIAVSYTHLDVYKRQDLPLGRRGSYNVI